MHRSWGLAVALFLLPACASQRDVQRLETQIRELQTELQRRDAQVGPGPSDETLAELESRLGKLESWTSQSETHALGLAESIEKLHADVERFLRIAGVVGPGRFKKGEMAPRGMTDLEMRQYAAAQGDPHYGRFGMTEALAGDATLSDRGRGKLVATFTTSSGRFDCVLLEDETPNTVANFVGLARGQRASLDAETGAWGRRRFYDGMVFHRVIKGFMIQGGDPTGNGTGGPGYVIADEVDDSLQHVAGALSMANRGPNTGSSQFFISVAKTPHLDGKHTIFGKCDAKVPTKISKAAVDPRRNHRPLNEVRIRSVSISRKRR